MQKVLGLPNARELIKSMEASKTESLCERADLNFGIPQVSVLRPLLFTLYVTPLGGMISGYDIPLHLYIDAAVCFPYIRELYCGTEWFTVISGLCPLMDVYE